MKATEQYFPVVLFIMLYKVVLSFDDTLKYEHSQILSSTSLSYLLRKVIPWFESVNKTFDSQWCIVCFSIQWEIWDFSWIHTRI